MTTPPIHPRLLVEACGSVTETAARLNVHRGTVHRWLRQAYLPPKYRAASYAIVHVHTEAVRHALDPTANALA